MQPGSSYRTSTLTSLTSSAFVTFDIIRHTAKAFSYIGKRQLSPNGCFAPSVLLVNHFCGTSLTPSLSKCNGHVSFVLYRLTTALLVTTQVVYRDFYNDNVKLRIVNKLYDMKITCAISLECDRLHISKRTV